MHALSLNIAYMHAGAGRFGLTLAKITEDDWRFHMDLNVAAPLWLTQAAAPHLEKTRGSIVNRQQHRRQARVPPAPRCTALLRRAVDQLTATTALELAPQGCVSPHNISPRKPSLTGKCLGVLRPPLVSLRVLPATSWLRAGATSAEYVGCRSWCALRPGTHSMCTHGDAGNFHLGHQGQLLQSSNGGDQLPSHLRA